MKARKLDYPTGNDNGMSFICNRWVFTGLEGYRVRFDGTPGEENGWAVLRYDASEVRACGPFSRNLTEEEAHEMAASLARRPVNPAPEETA